MKNIAGFALLLSMTACSKEEFTSSDVIAFTREGKIHVMDPDGTDVRILGDGGKSSEYYPIQQLAWSPDGATIAYVEGAGIYTMNSSKVKKKVAIGNPALDPTWSPNGRFLAYTDLNYPAFCDDDISTCYNMTRIFITSLDGSGVTSSNLLVDTLKSFQVADMCPNWSSDGNNIVFSSNRATTWVNLGSNESNFDLYVMNPDGTQVTRLTELSTHELHPVWSPDGNKIAFDVLGNSNDSWSIHVMNADGTERVQVTHNLMATQGLHAGHFPAWSPDGTRLAFVSDHDGNSEIYVINIDGTGLKRLTNDPANDGYPAWSPGRLVTD